MNRLPKRRHFTNSLRLHAVFIFLLFAGCVHVQEGSGKNDSHTQYFNQLKQLCGQRFVGEMTYPADGQDSFSGKRLVAKFESCDAEKIRVPFSVGADHSRTWIFLISDNGLQLQHDHRHADGTPDVINLYGGWASAGGSADSQSFYADQHTSKIIPEAATNVWTISLADTANKLTYHLERHGKPRFTAVLLRE